MRSVIWTPDPDSGGDVLTFRDDRGPWVLVDIDGHTSSGVAPSGVSAPRQMGATPQGVSVPVKVVTLTVGLVADSQAELGEMRRVLEHSMADEPPRFGDAPRLGSLRYIGADESNFDIDGLPQGGPQVVSLDPTGTMQVFDVSIWCPEATWKATGDVLYPLLQATSGGMEFPVEHPFEMPSFNASDVLTNPGHVSAPVLVRLYGEATNPRLVNNRTGEVIQIIGSLAVDEYVEIETAFGRKSVTFVDGFGVRTNALAMLDLTVSTFWALLPGPQGVSFEADTNVSGRAELEFRPRYLGV